MWRDKQAYFTGTVDVICIKFLKQVGQFCGLSLFNTNRISTVVFAVRFLAFNVIETSIHLFL